MTNLKKRIELKLADAIEWRGIDMHELTQAKNSQFHYFVGVELSKNNSLLDVEIWTNCGAVSIPHAYEIVWTAGGNETTTKREVTANEVEQVKNEILCAILAHTEQAKSRNN